MVQDLLNNDKVRTQLGHPAGARSSQVMHRPRRNADIEPIFGLEAVIGRGAVERENVAVSTARALVADLGVAP